MDWIYRYVKYFDDDWEKINIYAKITNVSRKYHRNCFLYFITSSIVSFIINIGKQINVYSTKLHTSYFI